VAELQQEDRFVKRARPSITYVGLFVIVFNYVFIPFVNRVMEWVFIAREAEGVLSLYALKPVDLPEMFWVAWGGVVAVYSVGRTTELIRSNKARTQ
jgi:predicted membrane channel-forming protein YqfA (hemolysin III family)